MPATDDDDIERIGGGRGHGRSLDKRRTPPEPNRTAARYCGPVTTKPEIEFPGGSAPTDLVMTDLVVGDCAEAKPGDVVDVHYVGVEFDTGDEFDSSWNRGESISFPLRGLIQGWQDGIPGMRVGGRRQLVIPPALAYGPAGGGHRLSGKTLIFVIDLLGVG